jgi:hypothetical protein
LLDDDTRTTVTVKISKAEAKAAEYTFTLRWVHGKTVCVFALADGRTVAQLMPREEIAAPPRKPREARRPTVSRARPPEERSPPPPVKEPAQAAPVEKTKKRLDLL